jgi:hypothetical protein
MISKKKALHSLVEKLELDIVKLNDEHGNLGESIPQESLSLLLSKYQQSIDKFLLTYRVVNSINFSQGGNPRDMEARKLAKEIVDEYQSKNGKLPTGTYLHQKYSQIVAELASQRLPCPDDISKRTVEQWLKEIRENNFRYAGEPLDF